MNIFDCINSIYIHTIYANLMYKICHYIGEIVFILIVLLFLYKTYVLYLTNMKTIDNTQNKIQNDNTQNKIQNDNIWRYEEYNSKPVQKEENTDGKCKPESNTSDADSKH